MSVRFPMNVPWLSPLPQQYVYMSSLDARVFCVPLVSIRLLLLGWSLDLCVIYDLSISSVYVQLWLLYFLAGIHRKGPDLKLFEASKVIQEKALTSQVKAGFRVEKMTGLCVQIITFHSRDATV